MNKIFIQESTFKNILKIDSVILLIVVYINSFIFLSLALFIFLNRIGFNIKLFYIVILFWSIFIFFAKTKNKKRKKLGCCIGKTLTIFVSIAILLLFLNSYLEVFDDLNKLFILLLETIETFGNQSILRILSVFVSILIYFHLVFSFLEFALSKIQKMRKFTKMISGLIIIAIAIFPFLYFLNIGSTLALNNLLYSSLGWLFGFSLVYLHLNYLLQEMRTRTNLV